MWMKWATTGHLDLVDKKLIMYIIIIIIKSW